uniref:uncharacterized protein LOC105352728 n=1 Tax=Fragaria vesca subsp. vesca TaxID=101020 RepID=UPI0005C810ED|nr:PREDICTED: uncharacterized protein LOC105352728 [Fragaria vesca subsp. vesca]
MQSFCVILDVLFHRETVENFDEQTWGSFGDHRGYCREQRRLSQICIQGNCWLHSLACGDKNSRNRKIGRLGGVLWYSQELKVCSFIGYHHFSGVCRCRFLSFL